MVLRKVEMQKMLYLISFSDSIFLHARSITASSQREKMSAAGIDILLVKATFIISKVRCVDDPCALGSLILFEVPHQLNNYIGSPYQTD